MSWSISSPVETERSDKIGEKAMLFYKLEHYSRNFLSRLPFGSITITNRPRFSCGAEFSVRGREHDHRDRHRSRDRQSRSRSRSRSISSSTSRSAIDLELTHDVALRGPTAQQLAEHGEQPTTTGSACAVFGTPGWVTSSTSRVSRDGHPVRSSTSRGSLPARDATRVRSIARE